MAILKMKYTLSEANEKIKELAASFPAKARALYMAESGVPYNTLNRYLGGSVPTLVAANHLAEYMVEYVKKNPIAA